MPRSKRKRSEAAIQAKAKEVSEKIDCRDAKGISFVQAAENAGYKPETPEPFALIDPGNNVELARFIAMNGVELDARRDLEAFAGSGSALIIHMISKEPIDEQKYAEFKKTEYAEQNSHYGSNRHPRVAESGTAEGWSPAHLRPGATG